jgi:hypothetical protein
MHFADCTRYIPYPIYGQHAELHDRSQKDKKRALPSSRDVTIMMQSQRKGAHQGNPACVGGLLLTNEAGKGETEAGASKAGSSDRRAELTVV